MTKEEALLILEDYISNRTQDMLGEHKDMRLPVRDEVIFTIPKSTPNGETIESWTFLGLIKIAYNL